MWIISRKKLIACWIKYPNVENPLKTWEKEAEHAQWVTPSDIKARYHSADILPGNRVVFNIKGDRYRLVVKIHYNTGIIYIRFIGTHEEYDKINAETI